ncbi:Hypothetical protein R9X50_00051700 [Acrodontium crateriforme]|uniref:F-box domain-containing protein n=1 Tax=Acrodontium crateriforme TaxID=150365 RepID=A0AAQ3M3C5_9PEZI|nr:Hypothetical protein R9X50_00051700 [Acrodontium crateriforme]
MPSSALTDLPPELLDHITTYLHTASSISNLGRVSKTLYAFVQKDAWATFNRTQFPSVSPVTPPSHKDAAQTLTALSRAWDRRAFMARQVEPHGTITSFPGDNKVETWKRPKGQTIGYTPHLDVYEEVGATWRDRREVLAFSAGAELCVREKTSNGEGEKVNWTTYRPLSALEGKDDITTLHLLRPSPDSKENAPQNLVVGTANGDLQLISLPKGGGKEVIKSYFVTQGVPIRSSSLLHHSDSQSLMVANLGDSRIALYPVNSDTQKTAPLCEFDVHGAPTSGHSKKRQRLWSTNFISPQHLAVGLGPSQEPIHIYSVTPTGIKTEPTRTFGLQERHNNQLDGIVKAPTSSVYPIVPLPPSSASDSFVGGNIFLSGAYDAVIRLHDLRSKRDVEQVFIDPTDDSSIYSLLPRGQEKLVAGTSRHSLLKVFDLRLGAKCYSYLDATQETTGALTHQTHSPETMNWNLFARPTSTNRHRNAESSVYSLSASSPHSPYLYLGLESSVVSLAFTGTMDRHPDPVFFHPWQISKKGKGFVNDYGAREVANLAMYDQTPDMKLLTQKSILDTWRTAKGSGRQPSADGSLVEGLDERWKTEGTEGQWRQSQ